MINRTVLTGRLTRDPELKSTSSGISVTQFTLAVNRQYTNQDGSRSTDFISCVAWRKTAETINKFFKKGSLIGIDGRLQSRSYDDKNGYKVYVTEVVVDNFSFLTSKNDKQQGAQTAQDPFAGGDEVTITEDDIQF